MKFKGSKQTDQLRVALRRIICQTKRSTRNLTGVETLCYVWVRTTIVPFSLWVSKRIPGSAIRVQIYNRPIRFVGPSRRKTAFFFPEPINGSFYDDTFLTIENTMSVFLSLYFDLTICSPRQVNAFIITGNALKFLFQNKNQFKFK